MTQLQFSCPRCRGEFQVDPSSLGAQVGCPFCGGAVMIPRPDAPADPPPAPPTRRTDVHVKVPPGPRASTPHPETAAAAIPAAPVPRLPLEAEAPSGPATADPPARDGRWLRADSREQRRFLRNLTLWVGCAILLIVVLWVLLVAGPYRS